MANIQHSALTSSSVHEPKHITDNGQGASGRVITNSSTTANVSEYRRLNLSDIDQVDEIITFTHPDATSTETHYIVSPIQGIITSVFAVIDNPVVGADLVYTLQSGGSNITPALLTFELASSAIGDVRSNVITSNNTLLAGSTIEITGNGGNTDPNVSTSFSFTIRRG